MKTNMPRKGCKMLVDNLINVFTNDEVTPPTINVLTTNSKMESRRN